MEFDVVIVGGGPAGLAAAIRLKQQAAQNGREISVCLIEKSAELGGHILSGAVLDPRALDELLPDHAVRGAPLVTPVAEDAFLLLSQTRHWRLPDALLPACLHNAGNFIVSLADLCRWLGREAEALGVEIYPGFAAAEVLYDEEGTVAGVVTGDLGRRKDGTPGPAFQPGMELRAAYTLFAEGCRGHLGKQLEARFKLRHECDPQVHGLGFKELWEVPAAQHAPGRVVHTAGWPLDPDTYGGGFVYHWGTPEKRLVSVGLVVGLGYANPYLSPYEEFQRLKTHPALAATLAGGRRLAYGARAIAAGGLQSLPQLVFPGGALIGDDAGFLNAARIKGIHAAMKSGMLAADACAAALAAGRRGDRLEAFPQDFRSSWLYDELHAARNFKPLLAKGLYLGSLLFGIDQHVFRGRAPWTLHHPAADHETLRPAAECAPIDYPKPDGVLSFDRLDSVYLSNTNHAEDQPCHLKLRDESLFAQLNLPRYDAPEQRYCPAGVYEVEKDDSGAPRLRINAQNCIHCKSCDIKDPGQNIDWLPPQGGEGPNYPNT